MLGLSGVIPIMVSMKQSGFYILTTFPFFAIGISALLYPLADSLFGNLNYRSKGFFIIKWIGYSLLLSGILLSLYFYDQVGRDKDRIHDTHLILAEVPGGSIINIYPEMWGDLPLHAYFARYNNVSLDSSRNNKRDYLLIYNHLFSDTLLQNYKLVDLPTIKYKLLKRE